MRGLWRIRCTRSKCASRSSGRSPYVRPLLRASPIPAESEDPWRGSTVPTWAPAVESWGARRRRRGTLDAQVAAPVVEQRPFSRLHSSIYFVGRLGLLWVVGEMQMRHGFCDSGWLIHKKTAIRGKFTQSSALMKMNLINCFQSRSSIMHLSSWVEIEYSLISKFSKVDAAIMIDAKINVASNKQAFRWLAQTLTAIGWYMPLIRLWERAEDTAIEKRFESTRNIEIYTSHWRTDSNWNCISRHLHNIDHQLGLYQLI